MTLKKKPPQPKPRSKPQRRRRILLLILSFCLFCFLSVFLALLFLPQMASTEIFRNYVTKKLEEKLDQKVRIEDIRAGWTQGVDISGIRIADKQEKNSPPLLHLEKTHLDLSVSLSQKKLFLVFEAKDMNLNIVRMENGKTNIEELLEQISPPGEKPPKAQKQEKKASGPPPVLPLDLYARIRMEEMHITARDRITGKTAGFSPMSLHLSMDSLIKDQVHLLFASGMEIDGNPLPKAGISLTLDNLFDKNTLAFSPGRITAKAKITLPGVTADLDFSAKGPDAHTDFRVDFPKLMEAVSFFLPKELSSTRVAGILEMNGKISGQNRKTPNASGSPDKLPEQADFQLDTGLRDIAVTGGILGTRGIGPFSMALGTKGSFYPEKKMVNLEKSTLHLLEKTRLDFEANAEGLGGEHPKGRLRVAGMHVDILEWITLAKDFLPGEYLPAIPEGQPLPFLHLDEAVFTGDLARKGDSGIFLSGFSLLIPGISLSAPNQMNLRDFSLRIDDLEAGLGDLFPEDLSAGMEISLGKAGIHTGKDLAEIQGLHVKEISIQGKDIRLAENADIPVNGHFRLEGKWETRMMLLPGETKMENLLLGLSADADISPEGRIKGEAGLSSLHMDRFGMKNSAKLDDLAISRIRIGTDRLSVQTTSPFYVHGKIDLETDLSLGSLFLQEIMEAKGLSQKMNAGFTLVPEGKISHGKMEIAAGLESFSMGKDISVKGVEARDIAFWVSDIAVFEPAVFGITGKAGVSGELAVEKGKALPHAAFSGISQKFAIEADLTPDKGVLASLNTLQAKIASLAPMQEQIKNLSFPLAIQAGAPVILIKNISPLDIDIKNSRAQVFAGRFFGASLSADAAAAGKKGIVTHGETWVDFSGIPKELYNFIAKDTMDIHSLKIQGKTGFNWRVSAGLPDEKKILAISKASPGEIFDHLDFVKSLRASFFLDSVGGELALEEEKTLTMKGISTAPEFTYRFDPKTAKGSLSGVLYIRGLTHPQIPPAGIFPLEFHISGTHHRLKTLEVDQRLELPDSGISQTLTISANGVDKALFSDKAPVFAIAKHLGANLRMEAKLKDSAVLSRITEGLEMRGGIEALFHLDITPETEAKAEIDLRIPGFSAEIPGIVRIKGLRADIPYHRKIALAVDKTPPSGEESQGLLSENVIFGREMPGDAKKEKEVAAALGRTENTMAKDHSFSLETLEIYQAPFPVQADDLSFDLAFSRGIPSVKNLQVSFLGGTVQAAVMVHPGKNIRISADLAFSGIDFAKLVTTGANELEKGATEVGGRIRFDIPLSRDPLDILEQMEADIHFNRIGRLALERLLYAMDPMESNEALVSQRKLLTTGTPEWIRIRVASGNLTMKGEVSLKGVPIPIPPLERFSVNRLPIIKELEKNTQTLAALIRLITLISSDILYIRENGDILIKGVGVLGNEGTF